MANEEEQDIILLSSDDESKPQAQVSMGASKKPAVNYSMSRKNMQTKFAPQVMNYKTSVSTNSKTSYIKSSQNVYSFPKSQRVFDRENRTANNISQRPLNSLKQTIPQSTKYQTNVRSANAASYQYRRNDQMNSVSHSKQFEKKEINKNINMVSSVVSQSNFSSRPSSSSLKAIVTQSLKNATPLNISAFKSNSRNATSIKLDTRKNNLTSILKVTQNAKSNNIKSVPSSVITALQKKGISVTNVITQSDFIRKSEPKLQASATKQQITAAKLQVSAAKQQASGYLDKLRCTSKNNCVNVVAATNIQNNLQSNYTENIRSSISQRNQKRKVEDTVNNTPNKFPKLSHESVRNSLSNPRNGMVFKVSSSMNATNKVLPAAKLSTVNNVTVKAFPNFQRIPNNYNLVRKDVPKLVTSKFATNKTMPSIKQPVMVNTVRQLQEKEVTIIPIQHSKNLSYVNNAANKPSEPRAVNQRKPLPFAQAINTKGKQYFKNIGKNITVPSSSAVTFPANLSLSIIPLKSIEKVSLNKNTNSKLASELEIMEISQKKSLKSLVGASGKSNPTSICRNIDLSKDRSALLSLIASSSSTDDNKLSINESKLSQTTPKAENNSLNRPVILKSFNKLDISKADKGTNVPIHAVDQFISRKRNIRSFKLCDALKEVQSWRKPIVKIKRIDLKLINSCSNLDELRSLFNLINKSKPSKSTNLSTANSKLGIKVSVKNQSKNVNSNNKGIKQYNADAQLIHNDPDLEELLSFLNPDNETAVPCVADTKLINVDSNLEVITYSNLKKLLNLSNPVKEAVNPSKTDDELVNKDSNLEKDNNLSSPVKEAINPSKVHVELINKDPYLEKQKNSFSPDKEASNISEVNSTLMNIDSDLKKLRVKEAIKLEGGAEFNNKDLNLEKLKSISNSINEANNSSDSHATLINIDSDFKKLKDLSVSINETIKPSKSSVELINKNLKQEKLKNISNPVIHNTESNSSEVHVPLINLDCHFKKLKDLSVSVNEAINPKAVVKLANKDLELEKFENLSNPVKRTSNPSKGNTTLINIDSDLKKLKDLSVSFNKATNVSKGDATIIKIDSDLKKLKNVSISVNEIIIPPEAHAVLTNNNLNLKERELRVVSNPINEANNSIKDNSTLIKIDSDLKKQRDLSIALNKKVNPSEGYASLINIDSDLKELNNLTIPVNEVVTLPEDNTALINIDSDLKKQKNTSISVNGAINSEVSSKLTNQDFVLEKLVLSNSLNEVSNSSDVNITAISTDSDFKKLRHLLISVHEAVNPSESDLELANKKLNLEKQQNLCNPDNNTSSFSEDNATLINIGSGLKKLKDLSIPVNKALIPSECDATLINIDSDLMKPSNLSIPISEAINSSEAHTKLISSDANLFNLSNLSQLVNITTVPSVIKVDSASASKVSNFDKPARFSIPVNGRINLSETNSELSNRESDFQNSSNPIDKTIHPTKMCELIQSNYNLIKLKNSPDSATGAIKPPGTDHEIYTGPSSKLQPGNSVLCKSESILYNLLRPVVLLERITIPPNVSILKNHLEKLPPQTSGSLPINNNATNLTLLESKSNSCSFSSKRISEIEICHKPEKHDNQISNKSLLKSSEVCETRIMNSFLLNSENSSILESISANSNVEEKDNSSLDLELPLKSSDINKCNIDFTAGALPSKDTAENTLNIELNNTLIPQNTYSPDIQKVTRKTNDCSDSNLPNCTNKKYVAKETKCRPWTDFNSGVLSIENTANFFMRPQNISEITVKNVLNNIISSIEKFSSAQFLLNLNVSSENSSHSLVPSDELKIEILSPKPSQTKCFTNNIPANISSSDDLEKFTKISSEVYSKPSCQESSVRSKICSFENNGDSSTVELNIGVSKSPNEELIDNFRKPAEMPTSLQNVDKDINVVKLLNDESLTAVPRTIKMLCDSVLCLEDIVEETCKKSITNIDIISSKSDIESHSSSTEISEEKCDTMLSANFKFAKKLTVENNFLSTRDVSMTRVLNVPNIFKDTSKTIDSSVTNCVHNIMSKIEPSLDMEIDNEVCDNFAYAIPNLMSDMAMEDDNEVEYKVNDIVVPKANEVDDKSTSVSILVTDTVEIEMDDNCSFNLYSSMNDAGENKVDLFTQKHLCTTEIALNMEIENSSECKQDLFYDHENTLNKVEDKLEKPSIIEIFDFGKAKQTNECSNISCEEEKNDLLLLMDLDEQITSPKLSLKRKRTDESPESKVHPAMENGLKRVKMDLPGLFDSSNRDQVKQISSPKSEVLSDKFDLKESNRKKYLELLEYSKTLMRETPETEKSKIVKNMMRQLDSTESWYVKSESFSDLLDSTLVEMKKKSDVFIILSQLRNKLKSLKFKSKGLKIESEEESNLSFTTRTTDKNFETNKYDSFPVASTSGLPILTSHTKPILNDAAEGSSHSSFSVQMSSTTCQPALETAQNSVLNNVNMKSLKFDSDNSVSNQGLLSFSSNLETFNDFVKNKIAYAMDSTSDSVSATKSPVSRDKINDNSNTCLNASISETIKPFTDRKHSLSESCPSSSNVSNPLLSKSNVKESAHNDPIDFALVKNLSFSRTTNNVNKEKESDVTPIVELESSTKPTQFTEKSSESFAETSISKAGSDKSLLDGDPFLAEASKHITQRKLDDVISKLNEASSKATSESREESSSKSSKTSREKLRDERHAARIARLEKTLGELDKKIQKLQKKELSIDDLDNDDSAYVKEELYKKRFMKVYKIYCDLYKQPFRTDRIVEKKFSFEGSRFTVINEAVKKMINKKKLGQKFPNYSEVHNLIQNVNQTADIGLSERDVEIEAERVFKDIGRELQSRRIRDHEELFGCYLTDDLNLDDDPAEHDPEMQRKLHESSQKLKKSTDEIFEKYVTYQEKGINVDGDSSKSADEDNSKSTDDDNSDKESSNEEPIADDGVVNLSDVDSHALSKNVESLPNEEGDISRDEEPEKVFSIKRNLPMDEDSVLPTTDDDSSILKGCRVSNSDDDEVVILCDSEKSTEPNDDVDVDYKKITGKSTKKYKPKNAYSFQNTLISDDIVIVNDSSNELPEIEDVLNICPDA